VVYLIALASAAFYGAADFLGGLAARRATTVAIVIVSQLAGLILLAILLPVLPPASPSPPDFLWGGAAGLTGGTGVALLYRALAVGTMGVVAPTTAVLAVAIPVMAAMVMGERPGRWTLGGIALAMVAIVLVSQQPRADSDARPGHRVPGGLPPGLGLALLSGVAIGLFFLTLTRTSAAAGMWPLVAARAVSIALFGAIAIAGARSLRMAAPVATIAVCGGALDMLANALYLIASRYGPLSVTVTLASLYPASTVALARVVLNERLSSWQMVGILCALTAVALIVGTTA
jgi:drug/metabolite transporter (DMT)-like permease